MNLLLASLSLLAGCDKPAPPAAAVPAELRQDAPKKGPIADWKAELQLTLEQKGAEWVFVLQGTTNVPKNVSLRARIYAVELVNDPVQGKREDEEPLVWEDEGDQPGFRGVELAGGKLREEVYRFTRKPWALRYRGRILYRPRDQSEEILKKFGDDEWSLHADLRFGTDADYAEELRDRLKETTDDLMALVKFYYELKKQVEAHRKVFDAETWKKWKNLWYAAVEEINDRNKLRFSLWAVWMERQAKMRIGGMCELLRRTVVAAGDQFALDKPDLTRVGEMLEGWIQYWEEAIEVIGIDAPLDLEIIGPLLHDYEIAFAPLRAWIETREGEDVRRVARRDCLATLFKFPPLLQNRKRAYTFVNEISVRFTRLLEASDAAASPEAAGALRKALGEHDEALREFKKFAGLK